MTRKISTKKAPKALGPYSQAVVSGGFVFCSGQIALTHENIFLDKGIEEQSEQVIKNLKNVLEEAGSSLDEVVSTTCYLTDMNTFSAFNEIYDKHFHSSKPARATVEVSKLPLGAKVEISAIAKISD